MNWSIPSVLVAVGASLILVFSLLVFILRKLAYLSGQTTDNQSVLLLQQQVESLRRQFSESLDRNLGRMTMSLDERLKVVGEVQAKLGSLEEASRQILNIGRDISSLQNILRAPKIRGGIGEFILENILSQMLPRKHYDLQYSFKSGEKVDAVVRIGERFVPVDAKFPLDNFRRFMEADLEKDRQTARKMFLIDVKKHVECIASKYIMPEEGTYDFSLMYIPAENVYYETIIKEGEGGSLMEYSLSKKVIPVSPNSFYAYLQVIIIGLRGMHIEESAREILARLTGVRKEIEMHRDDFRKLGIHLKNASGAYEAAEKRLDRMSLELEKLESRDTQPIEGEKA